MRRTLNTRFCAGRSKLLSTPPDWNEHKTRAEYEQEGKPPFTVFIKEVGGWWSAVCIELMVSGMGNSKQAALDALVISMRSTLRLHVKKLNNTKYLKKLATITQSSTNV